MKSTTMLAGAVTAASLLGGTAGALAAGHTYNLANLASGNWSSQNVRTANLYLIGFNAQHPNEQGAYFEFDLTPAQGKTISSANMLIIGSTDYHISDAGRDIRLAQTQHQFKVGIAPQNVGSDSVSQIVTGNNIANLYNNHGNSQNDNGYGWVTDGLHPGFHFDAWHYEGDGKRGPRLQMP